MNLSLTLALALGFVLGIKHAVEADHLVAVTTIVSEQRSILRSGLVGASWGVGHTISLLVAGCLVILLEVTIPLRLGHAPTRARRGDGTKLYRGASPRRTASWLPSAGCKAGIRPKVRARA